MNLKSFRALQIEDPRTAMIVDLTERFPRGPTGKLRKKDYDNDATPWEEPSSKKLIGGPLGYDIFEMYALCSKSWWESDLMQLSTEVEGAGMGQLHYGPRDENGIRVATGRQTIFKRGAQCPRRMRRLQTRLRAVKKLVEDKSTKNIYMMSVGNLHENVACFGQDETHAKQTFELLLQASFEGAGDVGLFRKNNGWGGETKLQVRSDYHGPAHGPHEILALNSTFSQKMRDRKSELEKRIEDMKKQIIAAEQLADLVDNFTLSTCAAFTEDAS